MQLLDRDTLWDLQLLAAVSDGGSLAAGARAVGITPSATSKRIAALERRLGVLLLHRTTRHLRLTPEGAGYLERGRELVTQVAALESHIRDYRGALRGELRISAPTLLGQELVGGIVARFAMEYPEVSSYLDLSDRFVDLTSEPYDLAVRVAERPAGVDVTVRKVATVRTALFASTAYVEQHGAPTKVAQLGDHVMVHYSRDSGSGGRSVLQLGTVNGTRSVEVRNALVCSHLGAVRQAVLAGLGIAKLPTYLVANDVREGRLQPLLPRCVDERRMVFIARPHNRYMPMRVRLMADMLARELARMLPEV